MTVEKLVLDNEALWELGEQAPHRDPGSAGAPRQYPEWVWFLYCPAVTINLVYNSVAIGLARAERREALAG